MVNWPQPNTMKQLTGFLSLTGYYRCFIATTPLTDLLCHESFSFDARNRTCFYCIKTGNSWDPGPSLTRFSQEFIIETNALKFGIEAMIMQEGHPIAFFSEKLGLKIQGRQCTSKNYMLLWRPFSNADNICWDTSLLFTLTIRELKNCCS